MKGDRRHVYLVSASYEYEGCSEGRTTRAFISNNSGLDLSNEILGRMQRFTNTENFVILNVFDCGPYSKHRKATTGRAKHNLERKR